MSYELQLAAEAKRLADELKEQVALIAEHLGSGFASFLAKKAQEKAVVAKAAEPIDLTPEEKQAILQSRLQISQAVSAKRKIA